uniref:Uncharacterized protein n=1 Tax=Monodelphis domestica TaxID=13616 RepID=A0A5F8HGQ9_MONDO
MHLKHTIHVPLDWKKLLPRRLETEFRRNFQVPMKIPELQNMNFRYGCNASLPVPAYGPVPSLLLSHIWNQEHSKKQSTYERHYGKEYLDFVTILNSLSESEIKEYLEQVPESGKLIDILRCNFSFINSSCVTRLFKNLQGVPFACCIKKRFSTDSPA